MMDLWLRFLTEVNESTTDVPQEFLDSPEISKALKIVEHGAYTEEQLYAYDRFYDIIATEHTLISGTFRSGVEKGRAEGEAIGVREEKLRNAKNFKRLGIDAETISKAIGLSIEEIEKL